jgi:endo-1,4-beta-xylanase
MHHRVRHCVAVLLLGLCAPPLLAADPPPSFPLWPDGPPGLQGNPGPETVRMTEQGEHIVSNVHSPSLTPYLPSQATRTGAAFVVVPGGGHKELWMDHEGYRVAQFFADHGVAAFILKYRLAREEGSAYTVEGAELTDLQRAIRTVRSRASEWEIDPNRIGVIGFSAGGELALLAGTRFNNGDARAPSALDRVSSRPDFDVVLYPGIPAGLRFPARTPPMFLLCGGDDRPQVVSGVTQIYLALRAAKVPAELHLYDGVGHGFGLRATNKGPVTNWLNQFVDWLRVRNVRQGSQP